jgi:hypothetical protein
MLSELIVARHRRWFTRLACAAFALGVVLSAAQAAGDGASTGGSTPVVYKPPFLGAPATRLAGATRSLTKSVTLQVVAPEHTGLTLKEQPILYWFISEAVTKPVAITLLDERSPEPELKITTTPQAAGIWKVDLARYGASLRPGIEYRWTAAVIDESKGRPTNILASGTIKLVRPSEVGLSRVPQGSPSERAGKLAQAGVWYDAVEALFDGGAALQAARAELFDQVGLQSVATFERGGAS